MTKDSTSEEAALRLAISRREEQLESALKELVRAAEARASLGHYVARYPWHFIAGAVVVGAWLGHRR
jgi:ElaB/YqjD/DUF883 family membrane-anchored ribosome-binding protein